MDCIVELDKTLIVMNIFCIYFGIESEDFKKILKKKENKYLFLLLLKNYKCLDKNKVKKILDFMSDKSIKYNVNRAEEKLLINKDFRDMYFEIEEELEKIFKTRQKTLDK